MQTSIAFKTLLILGICFQALGCKKEESNKPRTIAAEFSKPATNNLAIQKKRAKLKAYFDAKKAEEESKLQTTSEKKEVAKISFPYQLAPDFNDLKKELKTPIGKISGEIYGKDNDVYSVSKTQCGEGSVLQVVFKSGEDFQISPPIPVRFLGLATKKTVSYEEGRFKISVDFSEDSPDKLKGNFRIDFVDNDGNQKNYINLNVDGATKSYLLPVKMKGSGTLPKYEWCAPTAYVGVKQKDKDWIYGYAHITNVKNANIPKVRMMLSDRDGIDMLLIPLARGLEIPDGTKIDIATAREAGKNPAVLKIETWRLDEIAKPEAATGGNLQKLATALLLDGSAVVGLKKGKPWNVDIQIKDFEISSLMVGPFQDEAFSEIRVFGNLGEPNEMASSLPKKPDWWKKGQPTEKP